MSLIVGAALSFLSILLRDAITDRRERRDNLKLLDTQLGFCLEWLSILRKKLEDSRNDYSPVHFVIPAKVELSGEYLTKVPSKKIEQKFMDLDVDIRKLVLLIKEANLFLELNNVKTLDELGAAQVSKMHQKLRQELLNLVLQIQGKINNIKK